MKITLMTDIGKISPDKILGNIQGKIASALREISPIGKQDIKSELRSKKKTGVKKSPRRLAKYPASPARRSARGESLARDTGSSEKLITSDVIGSQLNIGFAKNGKDNYVAENELYYDRPTVEKSMNKTLRKVESIMNSKFKI